MRTFVHPNAVIPKIKVKFVDTVAKLIYQLLNG